MNKKSNNKMSKNSKFKVAKKTVKVANPKLMISVIYLKE